jgi:predicted transcriptional regulator
MPVTKIRLRMLEDGRPQYEIAAQLGVSPARLSEYALGRRPIPPRRVFEFVRLWNCNPDDIIGYEDVSIDDA